MRKSSVRRLVYIISQISYSNSFVWTAQQLRIYYDVSFILLTDQCTQFETELIKLNLTVIRIHYSDKRDAPLALIRTIAELRRIRPDVVHAHLFDAQLIGLTSALICRTAKRIYTRHNSNYHHVYYPKGVKYDLWSNFIATKIISLSQATDKVLIRLEGVSPTKIVKIPHGFRFDYFQSISADRVSAIRKKWDIPNPSPVIGVISRHIEWKGVQHVIPAFERFLRDNRDAILILANATGPYHGKIRELLHPLPRGAYRIIDFEEDVAALYRLFDIYVHAPVDELSEAFGQTYVEALAAGIPSIFTLSGIAADFVTPDVHACVVPFGKSEPVYCAMSRIWNDGELRGRLREAGVRAVDEAFSLERMIASLRNVYDE